ncbi:MAG TPA: ferritin family protein [Bradyrhizobium sp.]|nr:ferritin family protein [Bradyrhizobium sp.]
MSKAPSIPPIFSVADLLAIAYRIELDAVERYGLLADQMETHNNPELTKVFRDLSKAESIHAAEIRATAGDADLNGRVNALHSLWRKGESPEEVDLGAAHYLMTPWHALQLCLAGEKRALAFFTSIAETAKDAKVKEMAAELVEEEAEHVNLVYRLLRKYPEPTESWSRDGDPPAAQD